MAAKKLGKPTFWVNINSRCRFIPVEPIPGYTPDEKGFVEMALGDAMYTLGPLCLPGNGQTKGGMLRLEIVTYGFECDPLEIEESC